MVLFIAVFVFIHLNYVFSYQHQKALEQSLWSKRCKPKSWILNDCNWCWCDESDRYQCAARVCSEIDMFGHFKDAIQDINVGMEGHGSWRTTRTACSPGVYYRRDGILCVCNEDGEWPNPVCRDMFRVLYPVVRTGLKEISGRETCQPNKLHLIGCNVCLCPHSGRLDEKLCTDMNCQPDDPMLEGKAENKAVKAEDEEIYATCNVHSEYLLGCRKCYCLRNNRLMCDNCTERVNKMIKPKTRSYCDNRKPGEVFHIDCNSCQCDRSKNMHCTAKKCLRGGSKEIREIIEMKHELRDKYDDVCASEQYEKSCESCKCIKNVDGDILDCSANCNEKKPAIHRDCVKNTVYELNCMVCYCFMRSNDKRQFCVSNPNCRSEKALKERRSRDLESLHGYCEPLHNYNKDCNVCRCLADGKTLRCTSNICRDESVTVELVPVKMESKVACPKGHSYYVDCNLCFCLSNGDAVCTTKDCSK